MSVCVGGGWEITPSPSLVGAGGDARRCALLVRLRRWQRRWSGGTRGEWGHLARGELRAPLGTASWAEGSSHRYWFGLLVFFFGGGRVYGGCW